MVQCRLNCCFVFFGAYFCTKNMGFGHWIQSRMEALEFWAVVWLDNGFFDYWAVGLIAVVGPFATIFLAATFKALSGIVVNSLIQKVIIFNITYALFSLIPIPPSDGSRTFFGSRMLYAFSVSGIIAAAVLLSLNINVGLAIISSFFIGVALWLLYYIFFEHKLWHG